MTKFRRFRPRTRTIVKYVKTRARRYAPRKKNNQMLMIGGAVALLGAFVYKDKIKSLLTK